MSGPVCLASGSKSSHSKELISRSDNAGKTYGQVRRAYSGATICGVLKKALPIVFKFGFMSALISPALSAHFPTVETVCEPA